jgi:hypothetical protein
VFPGILLRNPHVHVRNQQLLDDQGFTSLQKAIAESLVLFEGRCLENSTQYGTTALVMGALATIRQG